MVPLPRDARWSFVLIPLALWATVGLRAGRGADWPTYRHDAARSGITSEQLPMPLGPSWVFRTPDAPQPAWADPKPEVVEGYQELRRVHFDDVFHPVAAGGRVFFGSSADGKVVCLDAATGQIRWTKITGGPVRLAPSVAEDRVFLGSDDGLVYCLDCDSGKEVWRYRAAPSDQQVLGHGKLISLWPSRTGVLVDEGVAYFGSGIFPAEGVFLFALDAASGKELWRNDTCGEAPQSRISPQGYLLASPTTLYAPMGRVSPASFDRKTGALKQTTYFGKSVGGTYALLAGQHIYTGTEDIVAYDKDSRDRFAMFTGRKLVVDGDLAYLATETHLAALDRVAFAAASKKLQALAAQKTALDRQLKTPGDQKEPLEAQAAELAKKLADARREHEAATKWQIACPCHDALILAGNVLVAGGTDQVMAIDATSGKTLWTGKVEGAAKGLAVADGRLLVSTDSGTIHAFAAGEASQASEIVVPVEENPFDQSPYAPAFAEAAETIIQQTGIRRGYCLVWGCETGQLVLELARRTELTIYAVSPDAQKVTAARKALDAAGLLGTRVRVEQWSADRVPYPDYFANLIVSETPIITDSLPPLTAEVARMLKPVGGTLMIGQPAQRAEDVKPLDRAVLKRELAKLPLTEETQVAGDGCWEKIVRGPLPGGGSWTHLYANAANTACGDDQLVKCPLGVLWFGNPGPTRMVNRHRRAAGPLAADGRIFVQGEQVVMAYDVYNGLLLWQREIPGAIRVSASHDGSNLALCDEGLLIAAGGKCLRLDPATGETAATYSLPPAADSTVSSAASRRWGYIACDDGLLFGSASASGTASGQLFAVELATGQIVWTYQGKSIGHNSIAVSGGRIFFVDTAVTPEQRAQAIEAQRKRIAQLPPDEQTAAEAALAKADVRMVVALDTKTGKPAWQVPLDLTHCGGGTLSSMAADGVLTLFGVYLDGHYWRQFFAGEFASRRVTAIATDDGSFLWSKPVGYRVRPLIIGDTLHAEPWAFDLHTGEPRTRVHPVTGQTDRWQYARPGHHCGLPIGSPNCLFFRSYNLGVYDLLRDDGTRHFGAQRPGCWINFIPTAGVLAMPEASAGCMCPFPTMCTVVFKPAETEKGFSYYSAVGEMTPVSRLGINFGASGDRSDTEGNLWLGYPRPSGSLVLQFPVGAAFRAGGKYVARSSSYTQVAGTDNPWLFTSAASGLAKCEIPLLGPSDGTAMYRVRLGFADPDHGQPGRRVFDVKLQGKVVLENFDIAAAAGGSDRAVWKQFDEIEVTDKLVVELVPKTARPAADEMPILQAVEVVRQRVLTLGCSLDGYLLSNLEPKKTQTLQLTNLREEPFRGTLQIVAPKGFEVTPPAAPIVLPSGQRTTLPVEVTAGPGTPAGDYEIVVKLVNADGTIDQQQSAAVEHLGRRGRAVLHPVQDTYVHQRYPTLNKGTAAILLIDGGDRRLGDHDHALAYLRFRIDVPGKPLSATLRIHNAGNPTGDSGRVCLTDDSWSEKATTYNSHPKPGEEIGRLGRVTERQIVECPLSIDLTGKKELNLVIDPTGCDGVDYRSRQSGSPPELIVEYELDAK